MNRTKSSMTINGGKFMRHDLHGMTEVQTTPGGGWWRLLLPRWAFLAFSLLLLLVGAIPAHAKGGDVLWQMRDTLRGKQEARATAVDANGNIIITGYQNLTGSTDDDYWTAKLKADGTGFVWHKSYNRSAGSDQALAVAVDANNDVIVTGYAWNGANNDIHTIKYSGATGDVVWQHTFNGTANGNDVATSIVVDRVNNIVYVAGYSQNAAGNEDYLIIKYQNASTGPDNPPMGVITYNGTANGADKAMAISAGIDGIAVTGQSWNGTQFDCLTIKYDFAGNKVREWRYQGPISAVGKYLKLDSQGNIIVTATVTNELDYDIYTAKYNAGTGAVTWQKTYNGAFDDEPTGLYVDAAGDAYVTGYTWTIEGNNDILTLKYYGTTVNPNGELLWAKLFDSGNENTDMATATGIVVDEGLYGDVFVTGYTVAAGNYDFRTIKYKKDNGNQLWQRGFNGPANKNDRPIGIGLSPSDHGVYVIGWSDNTLPLDGGTASATGGSTATIVNLDKAWTDNQWAGYYIMMTSGTNKDAVRKITSNTSTTLTVAVAFGSAVVAGDTYYIFDKDDYDTYIIKYDKGKINPPTELTAETVARDTSNLYTVRLSWVDNSANEEGFKIERKLGEFGTWQVIATVAPGVRSYDDAGLQENSYYYYRVWSFNAATLSDPEYSNEVHALTVLVAPVQPTWYRIQDGGYNLEDYPAAIAVGPDDNPVVTGKSDSGLIGMFDYLTLKLNRESSAVIWSERHDSMQNEIDIATCLAVDGNNNVMVSGFSSLYHAPVEMNINSVFTIKYPAAGSPQLWSGQYNGPAGIDDRAAAVTSATDGSSIVVVGHGKNAANNEDIYIVKYSAIPSLDPLGNAIPAWAAVPYDGGGDDMPSAVALAPNGDVFVSGYRYNGSNFDIFVARYNGTNGALIWSDVINGPGNGDDKGLSLAVDAAGDFYVAGYVTNSAGNRDYYVAKYSGTSLTAARLWARSYDGPAHGDDTAVAVNVDPVDNYVVVGGTSLTAPGDNDFHLIRYTPSGNLVWERTLQRPANDDIVKAMAIDYSGNIYIAGNTSNASTTDSLAIKYNYEGMVVDAARFNGSADSFDETTAVAVNSRGEAFIAGYTTNASGNADYLVYKMGADPLPAPYPFTLAPIYTTVTLTWNDESAVEDGFYIERKEGSCQSGNPYTLIASPAANATSYTDTGRTPGAQYCYRIHSHKETVPSRMVERDVTMLMPPAPGSFTAAPVNTTRIDLSWADTTTGETSFLIERCAGASCSNFAQVGSAPANALTYQDLTVCSNSAYRYRITAVGSDWTSAPATAAAATTGPSAPTSLTASRVSEAEVRLQWTDTTTDETGFRIERCKGTGCMDFAEIDTVAANATSYNDTVAPDSSTTYRYQVKAYKTAACSWDSAPSTIAETLTTLTAPGSLTSTTPNTTQVDLSWADTTASETGFVVERCVGSGCSFSSLDAGFPVLLSYNAMKWTDSGVCNNTTYTYRVKAVDRGLSLDGGGGWTKRAPLTITNFQPDFQTRVVVQYTAGMRNDFADIRFFDVRDNRELPYWLESKTNGVSATFWIKTRKNNNVYIYYGNPLATSAGSGVETFEFFDDFSGTAINTAKWTVANGSYYSQQNGELVSSGGPGSWSSGIYSVPSFSRPFVFEVDNYLTGGTEMMLGAKDTTTGISYTDFVYATYLTSTNVYAYEDGNQKAYGGTTVLNAWRYFKLEALTTGAKSYQGSSPGVYTKYYDSTYSTESPLKVGFTNVNRSFKWDNARVRKYAAVEPTVALGAEQTAPVFTGTWDSPYSNTREATTPAPVPPSGPIVTRVTEAEIKVQWTDNTSDESGFHIERCTGTGCDFSTKVSFTVAPNTTEYRDVDVVYGTTYSYRVSAFKTASCSWETPSTPPVTITASLLAPGSPAANASIGNTCRELRFMDDTAVSLPYWIESGCNTNATRLWVKVPSVPMGSKQIYIYTGNPPAPPVASGVDTFDLFDDFSGTTIDPTRWTLVNGSYYSLQGGEFVASGGTGAWDGGMYSVKNFQRPFIFEVDQYLTGGSALMHGAKDTTTGISYTDFVHATYNSGSGLYVYEDGSSKGGSFATVPNSAWRRYRLDVFTTGAKYSIGTTSADLAKYYEGTYSSETPLKVGFANNSRSFKWDNARVRKYANPEPTSSVSPEEYNTYILAEGNWFARRPITVTNSGPANLTDYQVPLSVDTTSSASDQVTLTWADTSGTETGFVIERCTGAGCDFSASVQFTTPANTASYTDWTVAVRNTYCYRVKAVKAGVWETPFSTPVCAATSNPAAPATLVANASETKVDLTWTDTTTGENGFQLERCSGASCDFSTLDAGFPVLMGVNTSSYSDTSVCGGTYLYRIRAFKVGSGGWNSGYSNVVSATTVVPTPPSNLIATRASEVQINLAWTDNTGDETGFRIERCEGSGCSSFASIGTVGANVTTYSSMGLKPDTTYRYRVVAFKTAACSWESPPGNIAEAATTIQVPVITSATAPNTTQVNLVWSDNTAAETAFVIERCAGTSCDFTSLDPTFPVTLPANTASWSDTSVCNTSSYRYRVKAVNKGLSLDGGSAWTRRAPLTVTNFRANLLTQLTVTRDPDMKADFSDIRFYDEGAYKELPYWIEKKTDGVSATVWIKTGDTSNIYLYYGNTGATSASNITNVFGSGLVGYWPFNETVGTVSGTSTDLSGSGNNVTLTNFLSPNGITNNGRYGNALSLDGSNDYAKSDTVNLPTGSVATIEAWIYPKGYSTDASYTGIVSWGARSSANALLMSIQNTGRPSMATWGNDFVPSTGPFATLNAWNHIAVVLNGKNVTLYMNGQPINGTLPSTPNIQSINFAIGVTDYPGRYFNGYIDEVRVFNRVLTANEIASRYAAVLPTVTVGTEEQSAGYTFMAGYDNRYSAPVVVATPGPSAPTGLTATRNSETQINLGWSDTTSDETGFKIERCEGAGCTNYAQIDIVGPGVTTYSDTNKDANLAANTIYRYQVRAYKTATCSWDGPASTPAQAETTVYAPASPTAVAANTTQINLSWTDRTVSETGFLVERCTGAGCDFSSKDTFLLGPNLSSWSDTTVCPTTTYRYQVKAVKRGLSLDGGGVWTRRVPLTINNFQQNFQTKVIVPYDTDMRVDFGDLRFYDTTAKVELPYWVESMTNGSSATIWVKTGKNNTVTMYYGNAGATSASNGATVFEFFDDFDGNAIDTNKWTITDATGFSVSGGNLHGTNTTGRITSKSTYSAGVIQDVKAKATTLAGNGQVMAGFYSSTYNNTGFLNHPGSAYTYNNGVGPSNGTQIPVNNMLYSVAVKDASTVNLKIYNLDVPTTFWNVGDVSNAVGNEPIVLGRRYDSDSYNGQAYAADWDWVRVRKFAAVEPAVILGAEEQSSAFAFNSTWESPYSTIVSATTLTPGTPSNLVATAGTDTQIDLTWTDNTIDETGFRVEQCSNGVCSSDSDFTEIGVAQAGSTKYNVPGLTPSKRYCFRIRATKSASCGWNTAYSNTACDVSFSAHPINLTASASGSFKVNLAWSDVSSDEEGFEVEVQVWNGEWVRTATLGANVTTYTDTIGIEPLKTYKYRVRAIRGPDKSPYSNEAAATTASYTPAEGTCR